MSVRAGDGQQALDVIRYVWRMGQWPTKKQWRVVLERTAPFVDKDCLAGAERPGESERLLSLVWAVRGDAFRELGVPNEAAEAYRMAFHFMPATGFTDYYLKLVLDHELSDHYETALRNVEESVRAWRTRPWYQRAIGFIVVLVHSPWFILSRFLPDTLMRERRRQELLRRLGRTSDGHVRGSEVSTWMRR